jgi:GAF domain-containing protein
MRLLRGVLGLSSDLSLLAEPQEISRRSVELVSQLLEPEWAGLFLGEGEWEGDEEPQLTLVASVGSVGASIALPGERIPLSGSPALALCLRRAQARVTELGVLGLSVPTEALALSYTSVLLPLRAGQRVLGILVLCTAAEDRVDPDDVDVFQMAADQIAMSLHRGSAQMELRAAMARARRAVQSHVESAWDALAMSRSRVTGYRYTPGRSWADDSAWLPCMSEAVRDGRTIQSQAGSDALLAAPLTHSGITIGAVGLRRPASRPWTEVEESLLGAVIDQVTQALENRRLFESARDRAQRERVLRQITERTRAQADLDGALAAAVEEMREITGATRVALRLVRPDRQGDDAQSSYRRAGDDR